MTEQLKLGMIGLDTSHVVAFTEILHNTNHPHHIPGARVSLAYKGGSPDFPLSASRVDGFANELREKYGVEIIDDIETVAQASDAIFLESVDGRVHPEQFLRLVSYRKPIFVDKPFALSTRDARDMVELAKHFGTPVMSSSALRFSEALVQAVQDETHGKIIGCDVYGPMAIENTQPGLFWYGIHSVEVLFRVLGIGCAAITAYSSELDDVIVAEWDDGRVGTIRGNRRGNHHFGAVIHREHAVQYVDISNCAKPYYVSMLEHIMELFRTGQSAVNLAETLAIVEFIERANRARENGRKEIISVGQGA